MNLTMALTLMAYIIFTEILFGDFIRTLPERLLNSLKL
jgi:hypothetical protein